MSNRNFEAELIQLLTDATTAAYASGESDALERIMNAAKAPIHQDTNASSKQIPPRKRAPRGSVRRMIGRILKDAFPNGLTSVEIKARAQNSDEHMVALASIRSNLNQNKDQDYREHGGRWFLIRIATEKDTARPVATNTPPYPNTNNS